MATYNWSNLSDHDFEMVSRDVLSAILGKPVEAFATGRDGGMDLRYVHRRTFVLGQAKHYLRSPYGKLLKAAREEKTKIDKAPKKPTRYILFTTQSLSPGRKTELKAALEPYCKHERDILGVNDLEGIIAANPDIEKHHYKLWLASARVLHDILGNATLTRSQFRVEELLQRAKLFVPHDAMPVAEKILKNEKNLIISGATGIGKTTLAEMLCLRFLASSYKVHFVSRVDEIETQVREGEKQLFLYDDFLGRTNLREAPRASEQERLFTFMRHIRGVHNKYLVMTTREYLYREARAANERLAQNRADIVKCVLDVSGYSTINRARILYNHLYWAPGIEQADLQAFVTARGYRRIIDHPEFNPRFIADTINRIAPRMAALPEDDALWT